MAYYLVKGIITKISLAALAAVSLGSCATSQRTVSEHQRLYLHNTLSRTLPGGYVADESTVNYLIPVAGALAGTFLYQGTANGCFARGDFNAFWKNEHSELVNLEKVLRLADQNKDKNVTSEEAREFHRKFCQTYKNKEKEIRI